MKLPFQYPFCPASAIHVGLRSQYLFIYNIIIKDLLADDYHIEVKNGIV